MNLFEEAVIYATIMHEGKTRKITNTPYILHPLEVSQIASTMTDDPEVITAAILHDIVEDTDGTLNEIRRRFGDRVASLVDSETEMKYEGEDKEKTWKRRKEENLLKLKSAEDKGVRILWLSDKLSNIRSIAQGVSEHGNAFWNTFNQKDPKMHQWYYTTIAETVELDLNRTGAFKEFLKHINFLWPGSFPGEKEQYKKYRELSLDGLKVVGKGAKSTVYRYNDELVIKVYNNKNKFKDIEREIYLAKKAFIAGIPTAISFGVVAVGERYGSLFELLNSECISNLIAAVPEKTEAYARIMADLALTIHHTDAADIEIPVYKPEVYRRIRNGLGYADPALADQVKKMVDAIPDVNTMIHGDFHAGNVMAQKEEYLLIDLDRLSVCHPIIELGDIYMFYIGFGELDPAVIENYMGFSYDTSKAFYHAFLKHYLGTEDEERLREIRNQSALLAYIRLLSHCYKKGMELSAENEGARDYYLERIRELLPQVDHFGFELP